MTDARATQVGSEVFYAGTPAANVTQLGAEVFYSPAPNLVVTQLGAEIWRSTTDATNYAAVTQLGAEVWGVFPKFVPSLRRRLEYLRR